MKALVCHKYGAINTMRVRAWLELKPQAGEVLIDVAYAAINFPDTLIVQGLYQVKPKVPFVPGHECSGIVAAVGEGVTQLKPGDRVMVSSGTGGIAEQICISQYRVRSVPAEVPLDVASTINVAYGTALHALKDLAQVQEGETVLVLGAAGGTGSAAVEIAQCMGAKVVAACGTKEKLDYCQQTFGIDLDLLVNYDQQDLKQHMSMVTNNQGVDVVFDPVGGKYAEPALRSLGFRGRYLVVGFATGEIPSVPFNLALLKERSIIGVYAGIWAQQRGQEAMTNTGLLLNWVKNKKLNPCITARFSLEQSVSALELVASRGATGKVVVEVNPDLQ
jgi:NADPH2:quinone reductase